MPEREIPYDQVKEIHAWIGKKMVRGRAQPLRITPSLNGTTLIYEVDNDLVAFHFGFGWDVDKPANLLVGRKVEGQLKSAGIIKTEAETPKAES